MRQLLAVALHDVEPASLARCRTVRDWLSARGVDRVTLLAIPAPRDRPIRARSSDLAAWLRERTSGGDAVAQHGYRHRQTRPGRPIRQWLARRQGAGAAEFVGLDAALTEQAVDAGREILRDAGIEPRGFVAPAYAYTPALRRALRRRYEWWADLVTLHTATGPLRSPALCMGSSSALKRATSPMIVRGLSRCPRRLMRVDVHPVDFDDRRLRSALERVLEPASGRIAVSYDQLVAG